MLLIWRSLRFLRYVQFVLGPVINKIRYNKNSIFDASRSLGISNNGYAGIGFQLMGTNKHDEK